jgi:diguanylate cyclase (GGDEF)-like protein
MQDMRSKTSGLPRAALSLLGLTIVVMLVGYVDDATGSELAFSIFYFFPIGLAAWYIGWKAGVVISVESAVAWYLADTLARSTPYSHVFIPAWNAGARLITFLTLTVLLSRLRDALNHERQNARIDPLTGAANSRAFYEGASAHLDRLHRYARPFGILYLDVDNLKVLNDRKGHAAGDAALKETVAALKGVVRDGDLVARLGGDEFAVLLQEVDERTLPVVSSRVRAALRDSVGEARHITFSIGALACTSSGCTVDEIVRMADDLMYEAKRSGKDAVQVGTPAGAP